MSNSENGLDLIDIEVHQKSVRNIASEMAITLMRTSGSPVVTQAKDFSTCILDAEVEQLAFSGYVTFHIATAVLGVKAVLRNTPVSDLRRGDIFVCNDPHTSGAIHQGDIGVVMPFFHEDELVAWGYVNEHLLDVGGSSISGMAPSARDCFSEALAFPGTRIGRAGLIDPQWEQFIATNVRMPDVVLNDIRSIVAANNAGQKRIEDLVRRISVDRFRELNAASKDISEKAMRRIIGALPDGTYESEDWIEYDGRGVEELHNIKCRLVVNGDEMTIQFRGVEQTDSFINGAPPAVIGQTWSTLLTQLIYDIPTNGGIWRPVQFDLGPPGSIVNSVRPAPVSQSHMECGVRITKLVTDVLSQACALSENPGIASRVAGQSCQNMAFFTAFGVDLRSKASTVAFPTSLGMPCGGGAQTVTDGLDTYAAQAMVGCDMPDVEMEELTQPGVILWRRVRADTGGAGYYRGGLGVEAAMAITHSKHMTGGAYNNCAQIPPRGASGGYPGAAGQWTILRDTNVLDLFDKGVLPTPENLEGHREASFNKTGDLVLRHGDIFHVVNGGGGGVGDPVLRPAIAVRDDVCNGYVSREVAELVYGVVLGDDDEVDEEASRQRRQAIRAERIGAEPHNELMKEFKVHAPLVSVDGKWRCGCCGEDLGDIDGNWRDRAVTVETDLEEKFQAIRSQVRPVKQHDRPVIRENFCPGCAYSLAVDVTLKGREPVPASRLHKYRPFDANVSVA